MRFGALAVGGALLAAAGAVALVGSGAVSLTVGDAVEVGGSHVEVKVGEAREVGGSAVELKVGEAREVVEDPLNPLTPEDPLNPLTPEDPLNPLTPEDPLNPLTPDRIPRVPLQIPGMPAAYAADMSFAMTYVERRGGTLDHTISYRSAARATNVVRVGSGAAAINVTTRVAQGSGRGEYSEQGRQVDDVCAVRILKNGTAAMDVRVQLDIAEVNVRLTGALQRTESGAEGDCASRYTGVEDGTNPAYGCDFFGVDLLRGGRFKTYDDLDFRDDDDFVDWECEVTITPIAPSEPTATPRATSSPVPPTPRPGGSGLPLCPTAPAGTSGSPAATSTPCATPGAGQ